MNNDISSNVEFAIKIKSQECEKEVKNNLTKIGITETEIGESVIDSSASELRLVIKTSKPWIDIQENIEQTGRRAVLVGFSDMSAVSMIDKGGNILKGVIRFCSIVKNQPGIVIDGVIDGLEPHKEHSLSIHEFGDISNGLQSLGDIYKNSNYKLISDETGRSTIRKVDNNLWVSELIGRSVAVSSMNSGFLGCGIISRAAGIFQNWKRICACDGVTIWDERDRPLVGEGRRV